MSGDVGEGGMLESWISLVMFLRALAGVWRRDGMS